jgi:hypothetical protein
MHLSVEEGGGDLRNNELNSICCEMSTCTEHITHSLSSHCRRLHEKLKAHLINAVVGGVSGWRQRRQF